MTKEAAVLMADADPGGVRLMEKNLTPNTIEVHRANIKVKLQIKSMAGLIHHSVRWAESERSN